jgi:hypothetical protein
VIHIFAARYSREIAELAMHGGRQAMNEKLQNNIALRSPPDLVSADRKLTDKHFGHNAFIFIQHIHVEPP